jgi:hypothetical protein
MKLQPTSNKKPKSVVERTEKSLGPLNRIKKTKKGWKRKHTKDKNIIEKGKRLSMKTPSRFIAKDEKFKQTYYK